MIRLIVTASNELYHTLSQSARAKGDMPWRAHTVLQGLEQAVRLGRAGADPASLDGQLETRLSAIVVDMSLHAADTLLETLHSKESTAGIPLVAVKCDGQTLPLALRRLCRDVLESDGGAAARFAATGQQTIGEL